MSESPQATTVAISNTILKKPHFSVRHVAAKSLSLSMVPLEHIDGLFAYAIVLTRNSFEAEDLVQEMYVRAIEAMGRLREDSNVKAWLYAILRNIWLNQVRQRRTRPKLVEIDADENAADLVIDSARDPHALYVSKVEREQVRQAIQQLSTEFREIIALREFAELSYQEIATLLNCPLGTVMSRLGRARSKLGTLLSATQTSSARGAKLPEDIVGASSE